MSHEVWFLMGAVVGGLGGYALALTINYVEYWRTHRAPIELDEQLEAFQRLQLGDDTPPDPRMYETWPGA